jgi:hypothetical protein
MWPVNNQTALIRCHPGRYERKRAMMNPPAKAVTSKLVTGSKLHPGEQGPALCNPSRAGLIEPTRRENGQVVNPGPLPLGMEVNPGGMATLRHHVENLLSLWCSAADAGDCRLLRELLGHASPCTDNECLPPGSAGIWEFPCQYPQGPVKSMRVFSNVTVWRDGDFGYYSALVQTWKLGSRWMCTEINPHEGRLKAGPQVWRWDQHQVRSIGGLQEVPETGWRPDPC